MFNELLKLIKLLFNSKPSEMFGKELEVITMKEVSQDTFKEMQEWRALAKKEAKEVFNVK